MSDARRNPPAGAEATPRRRSCSAAKPSMSQKLAPGLHIVATPIGNLGDITLRALEALAGADLIACEDTRVTRKLLDRYGIATPLTPYHEHNAAKARPMLLRRLAEGAAIALVSDAGTPLISDPGYKLVRAAQDAGHTVTALPGASAVMAALTVAGLPTDQFLFAGFLPPKEAARRARIAELARIPATLVLFEAGPRLAATLADLAAGLGEQREAALCRELTKLHEEIRRGDLATLAESYADDAPRGEIVLVIAPPQAIEPTERGRDRDLAAPGARARFAQRRRRRSRRRDRPAAARGLSARAALAKEQARQGRRDTWRGALSRAGRRNRRRGRSASRRSGSAFRRKAAPPCFSSPKPIASWRGAGKRRSARSTSSRAAAARWSSSRSRRARRLDDAAEAVTERGKRRIVGAAEFWLAQHPDDVNAEIRFDVILVAPGKIPRHIANAFDASR